MTKNKPEEKNVNHSSLVTNSGTSSFDSISALESTWTQRMWMTDADPDGSHDENNTAK